MSKKKARKPTDDPRTIFTPELWAEILKRLGEGESARSICRDEKMPCWSTLLQWLASDEELSGQYARAREAGLEAKAQELDEIPGKTITKYFDRDGNEHIDPASVQLARLKTDNLKWTLSKLLPKKYGEKMELTGADGAPLIPALEVTIKK